MLLRRFKEDLVVEIGIDEAGRGSFWGPIMAGAVIIPAENTLTDKQKQLLTNLKDSKKISPKKREKIAGELKELIPLWAVGVVEASEINDNGITWANQEAFRRAVANINLGAEINKADCRLLIDGILPISIWEGKQELIVEGDGKYLAIAAASILAKVEHDNWIQDYCKEHPECDERYDLCKSKGYGTAKHRTGIKTYGGHTLHRFLYIQNWLPGVSQETSQKKKTKSKSKANDEPFLIKI
jgi:ribonuclease HII